MLKQSLNGTWKVSYVNYAEDIGYILDPAFVPEGWLNAGVPEEIHATLRKAGLIKGHYYGKDLKEEQWIEEVDWVYYKQFYVDETLRKKRVVIEFEGLDTFCDIYLNGMKIGFGENMHLGLTIDVTDRLLYGKRNTLVIRFYSPVNFVKDKDTTDLFSTTTLDRILARKAQMNYSWDFCGRCVTTGIWKNVTIKAYDHNLIDHYYIYTREIQEGKALLGLEVKVQCDLDDPADYALEFTVSKDGRDVYQKTGSLEEFARLEVPIDNPQLWWPRPYGAQELYDISLKLLKNGRAVDQRTQKFGIRTVELIQEDQGDGMSFIFSVNGKRLFVRGANWVPINVVYTEIKDEEYEKLIRYAVEGNLSMLRVWGGGIYENEKFFELCDQHGIMIFHDFMFACGVYPQDDEFLANVKKEAEYILKKYRNYTSLVLWGGDNENDEAYGWDGRPYEFLKDKINRVTLKEAWERLDPHRIYIPSSPFSPFEFYKGGDNPKSPHQGDMHIYLTSPDPKSRNYYKKIKTYRPRFMSEFGFICLPEKDSYYKFNFFKKELERFERFARSFPEMNNYIENGKQHDDIIYYTQVYNAHALKYWIEYFRSLKWTCAGSLYWKFNDPIADNREDMLFPTLMSTVDFYKMPKMTFYYTKRAYEDVILACIETKSGYDVISVSEVQEDLSGLLTVKLMDFDGRLLWQKTMEATVEKDSSKVLYSLEWTELPMQDKYNEYIKLEFRSGDLLIENRYFLVDIWEYYKLKFKNSGLRITGAQKEGHCLSISLRAEKYARSVRLNILDQEAFYEDNYFDMDANSERMIRISLCNEEDIKEKLLYIEGKNVDRIVLPLYKLL